MERHAASWAPAPLILGAVGICMLAVGACTTNDQDTTSTSGGTSTSSGVTTAADSLPVLEDVIAPEWQPETRTEEIAAAISEGEFTAQLAIDALSLIVDGVPGATTSSLPPGEGLGGTYTRMLIDAARDELTPEQVSFVDEYYTPGRLVGTVTSDGTIEPAPSSGASRTGLMMALGGFVLTATEAATPTGVIDEATYLELLEAVHQHWRSYLPNMPEFNVQLHFSDKPGGMEAWCESYDLCHIEVQAGFTQVSAVSEDQVIWYFAHELFHNIQAHWRGEKEPPGWVVEGSADWAAYDLLRNETLDYEGESPHWFTNAYTALKSRRYSAWPLYENARQSGMDVYASVKKMLESPGPNTGATLAVGGLDGLIFRRDWSKRTLRTKSFDAGWWLPWPTHEPDAGPQGNKYALERGLGSYNIVGADHFAQPQLAVLMSPEVALVTASPLGGPLTTWTAHGTKTVGDGSSAKFCFLPDGCRCPGGTSSSATPMNGRVMMFSYPAAEAAVKAAVVAEPWEPDKECKEEPEPDTAESNGDPHLLTFDGLPYDVITLGEFVTARDPSGDFEVQTRHEPFRFGAGTTAVALGTGASRITFTTPDFITPEPVVKVDGVVTDETDFEVDGVNVEVGETEITAIWPDGSRVEMRWFLGWFVEVTVPPERSARMEGLLGSADGDFGNDLTLPDGTVVDTAQAQTDESPFVLAWAVDADTTLFDYEAGETVETFRIPHPNPNPPPIEEDALAECSDSLGDRATAHEVSWCAYDVSATGDPGFVDEYVHQVEDRVGDATIERPTATTTTSGTVAGAVAGRPTLVLSSQRPSGSLDAIEGTVLVAVADVCPDDLYVDVTVHATDDPSLLARAAVCDPSGVAGVGADEGEWVNGEAYVWLPGTTSYEVVLDFSLGDFDQFGELAIYTDPSPMVVEASGLTAADTWVLEHIADSLIYLPDPDMTFELTGFDRACGVEVYWTDQFPREEPFDLDHCVHPSRYDQPPTDQVVPLVVFSRQSEPVEVGVLPSD